MDLNRPPFIGKRRGTSTWAVAFAVISLPLVIGIALEGYWYVAVGLSLLFVAPFYLLYLEYKTYPKHSERDDNE